MSRLIAVYGQRHEPDWLVEDLRANLAPWVDGFAVVDDRARPASDAWGHEGAFRWRQRQAAIDAGADWVLVVDPDERLEDRAGETIRAEIDRRGNDPVLLRLTLRELFTPTQYRVDGVWGRYRRTRLYPVRDDQAPSPKPIHAPPVPVTHGYAVVDLDVNLYHLKMVEPRNRYARAAAYNRAEMQAYRRVNTRWRRMYGVAGMRLEPIPVGREFTPGYTRPYLIDPPRTR